MFNLSPIKIPDLSGRTILITGAERGIGAVLAGLLTINGARVYAGVLNQPKGEWIDHLTQANILEMDVTNPNQVDDALERIKIEDGKLDALVYNAGVISPIGFIDKIKTESLIPAYEVNVLGFHRVTCSAMPLLKKSGGVVVNAGTGSATTAMEGWTAYCSSKAAARMLTLMFAKDLEKEGVQYFYLGIPPTDTEMQRVIREAGYNPISQIPKKDLVDPKVPASILAWLCSLEARKLDSVVHDVRDDFFKAKMDIT